MSDGMAHSGNYCVVGSSGAGVDVSPEKVGKVLLWLFWLFRVLRLSSKKGILKKAGLRAGFFAIPTIDKSGWVGYSVDIKISDSRLKEETIEEERIKMKRFRQFFQQTGEKIPADPDCGTFSANEARKALRLGQEEGWPETGHFYAFQYRVYDCELLLKKFNGSYTMDVGVVLPGSNRMFTVGIRRFSTLLEADRYLRSREMPGELEECLKILVSRVQNE